jgi:hypothetical protein
LMFPERPLNGEFIFYVYFLHILRKRDEVIQMTNRVRCSLNEH